MPKTVTSCRSCLAWGPTYSQGVCLACYNMAAYYKIAGSCGACRRTELLKRGYCRLCWCQASLERPTGPNTPLLPYVQKVRHHQLFLATTSRRCPAPKASPRRVGVKGRPRKSAPPAVTRPRIDWIQPLLFDDVIPRCYRWIEFDLRSGPPPDNPWLAYGLHVAHTTAEARGFEPAKRGALQRVLVMLLAGHRSGELIRTSDFHDVVRRHGASVDHTIEVLQTMGVLVDDRPPIFDTWLAGKLDGLAPAIQAETQRWARILHDGGTRTQPRNEQTVRIYLVAVRPVLLEWSTRYHHLREVTRDDVVAYLDTLLGQPRSTTHVALRSLFGWAQTAGVIFRNPTSRIRVGSPAEQLWQPLTPAEIAPTIEAATTPHARVCVALAAVHAARHGELRSLQLDDVDLPNRRLTVNGRSRPLEDLTYRLLGEWLDYRSGRWPNTANPHLLISRESAVNLGPVSAPWVGRRLRGLPATLERLRIDRQLEEALTHGADPLHLAVVFDLDETTAIRYANNARQLLQHPVEAPPADCP